jgi:hypothetical protein
VETAKIVLVVGLLASAIAIGLSFVWRGLFGGTVTSDEVAREVILSFVVSATAVIIARRRLRP